MNPPSTRLLVVLGLPEPSQDSSPDPGLEPLQRALELCGAPSLSAALEPIHRKALGAAGAAWQATRAIPSRWFASEASHALLPELQSALQAQLPPQGLRVLQLSGLEHLLPLWRLALAELPVQPAYLLVLRHPLEVAEALRRSHGWSRDRGLLVWLQSTLAMEASSRGAARVVVEQEQLHWDPEGALDHLERQLNLQLPERSHERLLQWESEQPQSPLVAVPSVPSSTESSPLLQMAMQLHGWLLAESRGEERPRMMPEVICQQLAWAEALYGRTLAEEQQQRVRAEAELTQLRGRRLVRFSRWLRPDQAA
ncbi:hypothetical protein [Cyanobium sp. WAJ14-Wanaka]|uniref:hypothetical protein n=1 Tax=Cyanobium sp. WAJ14-Wanaka TaxID=2823725 RepID=UPI0020CBB1E8|nr:hypothetical protein [Cyanobium sp. WAJ14-Wanaka]MCP9775691.1 hypothetical protein [Cyanobium sp. WAJ14-Wanaka]